MIDWIKSNDLGDLSSIAGVLIAIVGFGFTLFGIFKAKGAAESARQASRETRDRLRLFENIVDFSAAIATLEEIQRLHRQHSALPIMPDRYATIRKLLIQLRGSGTPMSDDQRSVIQNALANVAELERLVERALSDQTPLKANRLNLIVSGDIDGLLTVLAQLKNQTAGEKT